MTPSSYKQELARFVSSWVDWSDRARDEYREVWEETLQNYLVRPWNYGGTQGLVQYPYLTGSDIGRYQSGYSTLKDPESHQVVESLQASEMAQLYGNLDGAIRCRPVGLEDAVKARVAGGLTKYNFNLPGHYRSLYVWGKDSKIFGTSILEAYWHYQERPDVFRSVESVAGVQISEESQGVSVVYDDVRWRPVDIFDFFWEPGSERIEDMRGCAKRFCVTKSEAVGNTGWDQAAVARALENASAQDGKESRDKAWREGLDRPQVNKPHPDFKPMYGYCYYGEIPFKSPDGSQWRRIEVLCGEVVRDEPWYGRIPFFEHTTCPIQGRFPGLAPLEVIRFSQDFTDSMKMSFADAVARMVYMSPVIDRFADVDEARLRRWRPDRPIRANRVDAINFLAYNPPIQPVIGVYNNEKQQMREGGGAVGAFQGFGLGVNRASATEAQGTFQQAGVRPESSHMLVEREYLPPLAKYSLKLDQRFIESDEDLRLRIGETPESVSLADIMVDFDVEFVGSRMESTKAERIASYRELFSLGANPLAAARVPWEKVIVRFLKELGLHEEAAEVNSMSLMQNVALQMLQGGQNAMGGNGNGTVPSNPEPAMMPEQTMGAPLV